MSVRVAERGIRLEGHCGLEDAPVLLGLLDGGHPGPVDISLAQTVHAAVWQVLMARQPCLEGKASDPLLARWLLREAPHPAPEPRSNTAAGL